MRLIVLDRSPYGNSADPAADALLRDAAVRAGTESGIVAFHGADDPALDGLREGDVALVRGDLRTDADLERMVAASWKLEARGVRCLPGAEALVAAEDKLRTYVRLRRDGIPTPRSVTVCVTETAPSNVAAFHAYLQAFPVVVRRRVSWGGRGTSLCEDREALTAALAAEATEQPDEAVLLQPYFPHRRSVSVRVVRGAAVGATSTTVPDGDFRAHTNVGGAVTEETADEGVAALGVRAAAACGLEFGTVDFLDGGDGVWLCSDVNSMPALRGGDADERFADAIVRCALGRR